MKTHVIGLQMISVVEHKLFVYKASLAKLPGYITCLFKALFAGLEQCECLPVFQWLIEVWFVYILYVLNIQHIAVLRL